MANRSVVDLSWSNCSEEQRHDKCHYGDTHVNRAGTVTSTYNVDNKLALKVIETTYPDHLSIIGDRQADLDDACNSAMWMRKVYLQTCNLVV